MALVKRFLEDVYEEMETWGLIEGIGLEERYNEARTVAQRCLKILDSSKEEMTVGSLVRKAIRRQAIEKERLLVASENSEKIG